VCALAEHYLPKAYQMFRAPNADGHAVQGKQDHRPAADLPVRQEQEDDAKDLRNQDAANQSSQAFQVATRTWSWMSGATWLMMR
jgi:hypothetical protein